MQDLINRESYQQLYQEWTSSRYYPETSFFDFLLKKGIRIVDTEKLKLQVLEVTDIQHIPIEKAGIQFWDILRDIIEGKENGKT